MARDNSKFYGKTNSGQSNKFISVIVVASAALFYLHFIVYDEHFMRSLHPTEIH